jgi:hypothetical protein
MMNNHKTSEGTVKSMIKILEMVTDKEQYARFINDTMHLGAVNEEAMKGRVAFISGLYIIKTLRFQQKAANLDTMSLEEVKELFDEMNGGDDYELMDTHETALMMMYYPELHAVRSDLTDRVLTKLIELKNLKTI